jgi:uracil-DNA glycosylase family 4
MTEREEEGKKKTNANIAQRLVELNGKVITCRLCARLAIYREELPPRRAFAESPYWRRPVPSFGDPDAWLLIVGLAPAAHGGNRTGRVFTGDESGRFLIDVLHSTGFANQPTSTDVDDGLVFKQCYVVASVRCAPPDNKPTAQEFENCREYLVDEMRLLSNVTHVLALGKMAFDAYLGAATQSGAHFFGDPAFGHGRSYRGTTGVTLYSSYHPSPRNTYTGKLTRKMLVELFERIKKERRSGYHRGHCIRV